MTKKKTKMKIDFSLFSGLANDCARDACDNNFASRRGGYFVKDIGGHLGLCGGPDPVYCVYNNYPYSGHPDAREQERQEILKRLETVGITEVGYAVWPPAGAEDAGYTYAMLLAAARSQEDLIRNVVVEVTRETLLRMSEVNHIRGKATKRSVKPAKRVPA
jgi:hypothetical protein